MSRQYTDAEEIDHLNEQCDIFVCEINENAIEISRLHAEIERLKAIEKAALAAYRYHMTGYGKNSEDFNANVMLDLMNELGAVL